MSKVLKLLQYCKEEYNCNCLNRMVNCKVENITCCETFEKILEENKEHINFVFDRKQYHLTEYQNNGNKYGDFVVKYFPITSVMCINCLWYVITNYNDTPIGDKIFCYN
jgi:hypothetical protein